MNLHEEMILMGSKAVAAGRELARLSTKKKNTILEAMADELTAQKDFIQEANAKDLAAGKEAGLSSAMLDRLELTDGLQIIGVSGTATTFGAIHLGLRSYNRNRVDGLWMPTEAARGVTDRLLDLGLEGRSSHPGIGRGRAALVLSGAAILMTILRSWPVPRMRIADRGLREGMLYGLMRRQKMAAE